MRSFIEDGTGHSFTSAGSEQIRLLVLGWVRAV